MLAALPVVFGEQPDNQAGATRAYTDTSSSLLAEFFVNKAPNVKSTIALSMSGQQFDRTTDHIDVTQVVSTWRCLDITDQAVRQHFGVSPYPG